MTDRAEAIAICRTTVVLPSRSARDSITIVRTRWIWLALAMLTA